MTLPPSLKAGFRLASVSTVESGRMPSSAVINSSVASPLVVAHGQIGTISWSKRPSAVARAARRWLSTREGVEVLAGDAPLVGDHLGADALVLQSADRLVALAQTRGPKGKPASLPIDEPMGTRVITSTPAATTTS